LKSTREMSDPADLPPTVEGPPLEGRDSMTSRRRLLRGGLAAAPVLMTLVSRPVLAQVCTTPSGYVSANASTAGRGVACSGRTPDYWVQHPNEWPSGFKASNPQATRFNDQFSPPLTGNPLLFDVLGNSTNNVARYVSAALLNAAGGLTPPLASSAVKDVWSEWAGTGHFSPSSGALWDESEIIAYLLTTIS
jgi:hypothetical protein